MMFVMHDSERYGFLCQNGKPLPKEVITRRCGCTIDEFNFAFDLLLKSGVPSITEEGIIYSRRMEKDAKIREIRSKSGSLGGRPPSKNYGESKTKAKTKAKLKQNNENDKEVESWFEGLWVLYPNKDGRKDALKYFKSTVSNSNDLANCKKALENYLKSDRVKNGYVKNGSTWFNNWKDWVDYTDPPKGANDGKNKGNPAGTVAAEPGKYDNAYFKPTGNKPG